MSKVRVRFIGGPLDGNMRDETRPLRDPYLVPRPRVARYVKGTPDKLPALRSWEDLSYKYAVGAPDEEGVIHLTFMGERA